MLIEILVVILILLVIERIIVSRRKAFRIDPTKINHMIINDQDCFLIPETIPVSISPTIIKAGDHEFKGMICYDVPVHVSEKLKLMRFDRKVPINSLCSIWNCYTGVNSGRIFGGFKMISKIPIPNLCICDNKLYC